jgi:phage terminase small subunit
MKCTVKQLAFVKEYLSNGGNATQAYKRAYNCVNMKDTTIGRKATELKANDTIAALLKEVETKTIKSIIDDRKGVLNLFADLATADANELAYIQIRCCRHCFGKKFKYQWIDEDEFGKAIAAILDFNATAGRKRPKQKAKPLPLNDGGFGFDHSLDVNPDCYVCKGDGVPHPRVMDTRKLTGAARRLYKGYKLNKQGQIEILFRDQDAAAVNLARVLGAFKDSLELTGKDGAPIQTQDISIDPTEASRQYQEMMKGKK